MFYFQSNIVQDIYSCLYKCLISLSPVFCARHKLVSFPRLLWCFKLWEFSIRKLYWGRSCKHAQVKGNRFAAGMHFHLGANGTLWDRKLAAFLQACGFLASLQLACASLRPVIASLRNLIASLRNLMQACNKLAQASASLRSVLASLRNLAVPCN